MEYYFSQKSCSHGEYMCLMIKETSKEPREATKEEADNFLASIGGKMVVTVPSK